MSEETKVRVHERRWVVLFAALLVVAAPLVGLAVFVYVETTAALKGQALQEKQLRAQQAARHLENQLNQDIIYGRAYTSRPRVIDGLQRGDKHELDLHLKRLVEDSDTVGRAVILSERGIMLAAYPEDPLTLGQDFSHRDWYQGVSRATSQRTLTRRRTSFSQRKTT
jgi:hypothetical protein